MSEDVKEWLATCEKLQQAKVAPGRGRPPLEQGLEGRRMLCLGMDISGPLRDGESCGKYILVMQDYFSKYVEIFPLCDHCATTVANMLMMHIFAMELVCVIGCTLIRTLILILGS